MDQVIETLGVLVGVSIFNTGFLSLQLRTQLSDAEKRLENLEDRIRESSVVSKWDAELSLLKLKEAANPDPVAKLPLRLNFGILAASVFLAIVAGLRSKWEFTLNPRKFEVDFLVIVALCATEAFIVYLGIAEVRWIKWESQFPGFNSAISWLSEAEERMRDAWFEQAMVDCRSGLDIAPDWPPLLTLMGRIHLARGLTTMKKYKEDDKDEEIKKALLFAQRATGKGNDREAVYFRAETHLRVGDLVAAETWYKKSSENDFEVYSSWHNLGAINLIRGNLEDACRFLQAALNSYQEHHGSTEKRFDYSQWNLHIARKRLGHEAEANKLLKIANANWTNTRRYRAPLRQPKIAGGMEGVLFIFTPIVGVDVPVPTKPGESPLEIYQFEGEVPSEDAPPWSLLSAEQATTPPNSIAQADG